MKKLTFFVLILLTAITVISQPTERYHRVKVFATQPEHFPMLMSTGISMESLEYHPGKFFVAEYSDTELQLLKSTGIPYEILIEDVSLHYQKQNEGVILEELNRQMKQKRNSYFGYTTPVNFSLGSLAGYHTYDEILQELDEMHILFPGLISPKMPASATQTIEGRTVYYAKISNNPTIEQNKPKVLYTALTHAREPMGMQQMLFQMWYLLENYATNPEIRYLVDNLEIYFIPCVNPDGYIYNQTTNPNGGGMWRKNRRNNGDDTYGVDLNRNFGYMWGYDNLGSSPVTSSQTYRGTGPFSEPETQVVKQFCESRQISLALNNHTYSNLLIYPWGYANMLTPDSLVFIEYAKRMTRLNGYRYGTCYQTLNYTANGGSDDWFYGEQTTKNKIIAFTPEAGDPADGFWPAATKIEATCAGHSEMNLYLMRFALPYAEMEDISPLEVSSTTFILPVKIKALGQFQNVNFTVSIEPLSNKILSVGEPVVLSNMQTLDEQVANFPIVLKNNIASGTVFSIVVKINNGLYTFTDTITKYFGNYISSIDNCETMNKWVSSIWGTTTSHYVSPTSSICDSPSGNYSNNANTTITYVPVINLTNAANAFVEFYAKWHIEQTYDYVQFQVSENGTTWVALPGRYTVNGSQAQGQPLWDGEKDWVQERISLNGFLGKTLRFRFRLVSDGSVTFDGFYFDDFAVHILPIQSTPEFILPQSFSFDQGDELTIDFEDFITAYSFDNINLSWSGNNNIAIQKNEWVVNFSTINPNWYGQEVIDFVLSHPNGQIQQQTTVQVNQIVGLTALNNEIQIYYSGLNKQLHLKKDLPNPTGSVVVYNIYGQKVLETTEFHLTQGIDVTRLARGVYLVRCGGQSSKVVIY